MRTLVYYIRIEEFHLCVLLWRQDSSLVAWLTKSPGVPGLSHAAAEIFHWCSDPVTVEIRGILMTTKRITD